MPSKVFTSVDGPIEADDYLDNYSNNLANNTHYMFVFGAGYNHNPLSGNWSLMEGQKTNESYEWQLSKAYSTKGGITIYGRSKINGAWNAWSLLTNI